MHWLDYLVTFGGLLLAVLGVSVAAVVTASLLADDDRPAPAEAAEDEIDRLYYRDEPPCGGHG